MKKCNFCSESLPDNTEICPWCGRRQPNPQPSNLESELLRMKQDEEQAARVSQEAQQGLEARRKQIKQTLIFKWKPIVKSLLEQTARATWGNDGYTLIEPDGDKSTTWAAVRTAGEVKLSYQIVLIVPEVNSGAPSSSDADLPQPGFVVAGKEAFECDPTEEDLVEALKAAFQSGPRADGLDEYTLAIFKKAPYKQVELEAVHLKLLASVIASLLIFGLGLGNVTGFIWILFCGYVLWITSWCRRYDRLSSRNKVAAVAAAVPGVIIGFAFAAVILYFIGSGSREARISEIEEGVKRGMQ